METTLTREHAALLKRIKSHRFNDGPHATQRFGDRLMRENGWPAPFARRAIDEYRRFAFIAVAGGHPVSPPEIVDQVWHLHLLYTRNYWDVFCRQTLGRTLHHEPATGADGERAHLGDAYAATLASYCRFFGEPPADIWPAPDELAHTPKPLTRRVDLNTNVVLSRRALLNVAGLVALAVLLLIVAMVGFALL
jgi:hypothetical protein